MKICNRLIIILLLSGETFSCSVLATAEFDQSFMVGTSAKELSQAQKSAISPGIYSADVFVNKEWKGKYDVKIDADGAVYVDAGYLKNLDIKTLLLAEQRNAAEWVLLVQYLEQRAVVFHHDSLRLEITVPQADIIAHDKNWLPPELWDKGISGLYTNYNMLYSQSRYRNSGDDQSYLYLSLNSGLNLADWHFRDNSYYYRRQNAETKWVNRSRYLEKSLPAIDAIATLGNNSSNADWFDSFDFRGLGVKKDLTMLPDSYRTYMPVIKGTADGNAVIKVLQDGKIIYQQSVPGGPFIVADLMPTGSRSDLNLVIENANGTTSSSFIPYSAASSMLRSGSSDWLFNAGQLRTDSLLDKSYFSQVEYSLGVNNYLTLAAGSILSSRYKSGLIGASVLVPYAGTLSASVEQAALQAAQNKASGSKSRIAWNRYFSANTNVTVSLTHKKPDYLTLNESDSISQYISNKIGYQAQEKNSLSISVDQRLPEGYGTLSASIYTVDYWNTQDKSKQYSLGWSNSYNNISWTLNAGRRLYSQGYAVGLVDAQDRDVKYYDESYASLSLSIPITIFERASSISSSLTTEGKEYSSSSLSWNQQYADNLRYNLSVKNSQQEKTTAGGYVSYDSPFANLTGNVTKGSNYSQYGVGATGSILASRYGVLTSPRTGSNFVIIDAPGVSGAKVNGNGSFTTNSSGKTLIPYAKAWRKNSYYLRSEAGNDVLGNIKQIAPWKGSISYVKYITDTRQTFSLRAADSRGKPLSFGSSIFGKEGHELGYVAQGSLIYIKANTLPDYILIKANGGSCVIRNATVTGGNICK
ncbi:fimbria/pilus outer membrane usher protein [Gibbsiella quercinecans]|uniref:fimbria/pilus outer membrane usher protein n=1 Tax=Gibbsiella quercinecans TaxID=929813 RepID=UPI00242CB3C0|nr:fimbria/pilus outer membrane usher protein [Gibbsiella quercinecans]